MAEPFTPLIRRRAYVGGAEETTKGTLPTISGPLSSTNIYNAVFNVSDIFGQGQRAALGKYGGRVKSVPGLRVGTGSFTLQPSTANQFIALLTMCGMTSGHFESSSSARKTWGLKCWEDGRLKALAGAAAELTLRLQAGAPLEATFDAVGVWQAVTDSALPSVAPVAAYPYIVTGITLTLGGAALPLTNLITISTNNQIEVREDVTNTAGILCYDVVEQVPTISMDAEARLVAQLDQYGALLAGTEAALSISLASGANTLTIACPAVQRVTLTDGERGGKRVDNVVYQANVSSGDDAITISQA